MAKDSKGSEGPSFVGGGGLDTSCVMLRVIINPEL